MLSNEKEDNAKSVSQQGSQLIVSHLLSVRVKNGTPGYYRVGEISRLLLCAPISHSEFLSPKIQVVDTISDI